MARPFFYIVSILSLFILCSVGEAQRFSPVKPSKREIATAVRDAKTHLPKMERALCLLAGNCKFPQPAGAGELELVKTGARLRASSLEEGTPLGITQDIHLPSELKYISPGSVRVKMLKGEVAELVFFREPLSRRGVVVYGDTVSDPISNITELQPKWRFGFQTRP